MKWKIATLGVCTMAIMAGCAGHSPEEKLFGMYESAAAKEKDLANITKQKEKLEKEEMELFKKVLEEGKDTNKEVQDKMKVFQKNTKERKELTEKAHTLLAEAKKETEDASEYVEKLKDTKQKEKAKKVVYTYDKRFESFKKYQKNYEEALKKEEQLQQQLKTEKTDLKEMNQNVQTLNSSYQKAQKETDFFNTWSQHHNDGKIAFYKEAGFDVKVKK